MARESGRPPKLTNEQLAELVERYEAGESAVNLAAEFGIHKATVYRQLWEFGSIRIRPWTRRGRRAT